MAELIMPMKEVICLLKNVLANSPDNKFKQIDLVEKNKIKVVISFSKLFPDIPAVLGFHSFNSGVMKFEISTSYPLKLIQPFINSISIDGYQSNIIYLENNILVINMRDVLKQYMNWLDVKDVKMRSNNLIFILSPSINE